MTTSGAIKAGRAFVELFADDSKLTRTLNLQSRKLKNFGKSIGSVGTRMASLGATASLPFLASLKVFSSFSDRMLEVKAITGSNEEQFRRLEAQAKHLGSTTAFTASQAAEGMKFLGMAGYNTEQILAGIPAVLNLAQAGAVELGTAADIASDVGSAFGMTADEIGHLADVMAVTASSANTSIEMMGETLKYAAPLAKAAGQSLEDTAAAVGVLGNNGIKASMAGTDLALIMKKVGSESVTALKKMGVDTLDAQGNVRPLIEIMKELGEKTKHLSSGERLDKFSQAFGRAAKSALILADSGDGLDQLRAKIEDADGAAERMAETMGSGIGGATRRLFSAIEGIAIAVGDAVEPMVSRIAEGLSTVGGYISKFVSQNKGLAQVVLGGIVALTGVGSTLTAVGASIGFVGIGLGALAPMIGAVISAVTAMGGLLATVFGAITVKAVLVASAVAAVTYELGVFNRVGSEVGQILDWMKERWGKTFGAISTALSGGDIGGAFKIFIAQLKVDWYEATDFLKRVLEDTLTSAWKSVTDNMPNAWKKNLVKMAGMFATFMQSIEAKRQKAITGLSAMIIRAEGFITGKSEEEIQQILAENEKIEGSDWLTELTGAGPGGQSELENKLDGFLSLPDEGGNNKPREKSDALKQAEDELEKLLDGAKNKPKPDDDGDKAPSLRDDALAGPRGVQSRARNNAVNRGVSLRSEEGLSSIARSLTGESKSTMTDEQKKTNTKMDRLIDETQDQKRKLTRALKDQNKVKVAPL